MDASTSAFRIRLLCALITVLLALMTLTTASPAISAVGSPDRSTRDPAQSCERLTLRERAAQAIMTGIPGTTATPLVRRLVARDAGSVILFGPNIEGEHQLKRLISRMRNNARARLLVAVDEEGGRVSRLGEEGLVTHLPSARKLARTRTVRAVRRLGARLGRQMSDLDVDWNLAPVLDVTGAPANSVIGNRSYSDRPGKVASYGGAFAKGLSSSGILTTGKHFPGHGRTTVDPHEDLPVVRAPMKSLWRRDIRPFRMTLSQLDAVMSAHIRYTALDRRFPASLSRDATRLLRKRLGFDGLLITDALNMGAIVNRWGIVGAAVKAIKRGADIALVNDWTKADDAASRLAGKVRSGKLKRSRLNHAVRRVLRAKGYGSQRISCLLG